MNTKEIYKLHADFCKFMGNAKRIEILFILGKTERCVDEIARAAALNIANVSQHLSVMREKGVVEVRRDGVKKYYRLSNPRTLEACIIMRDLMIEQVNKKAKVVKNIKGTTHEIP